MYLFRNVVFVFLVISLTQCKKDNPASNCINSAQKNSYVQSLEPLSHDTIQFHKAERQFLNEIRAIANDVDILSSAIDTTLPLEEYYTMVKSNFQQHADLVAQKADLFYNGSEAKVILARNAFVLMSYDALQRKYPEFMWTQLGVFAANEVRSGLVLALMARDVLLRNNIHIPFNNIDASEI